MNPLASMLLRASREDPSRIFLRTLAGVIWTYRDLDAVSGRMAHALRRLGISPGDRVAVQAQKSGFDNVGPRFEYVRHGADWQQLLANLDVLRPLMKSGQHWGGIHSVYNVYNATRLVELTEFARERELTIHWQSLYQPECLDPQRLGPKVKQLALSEIQRLLDLDICLDSERQFFTQVRDNIAQPRDDLRAQLFEHTAQIEQQYHPQSQGQFARLWPELNTACELNQ